MLSSTLVYLQDGKAKSNAVAKAFAFASATCKVCFAYTFVSSWVCIALFANGCQGFNSSATSSKHSKLDSFPLYMCFQGEEFAFASASAMAEATGKASCDGKVRAACCKANTLFFPYALLVRNYI